MKKIGNLLFTLMLMGIVLIVYKNIDKITDFVSEYLISKNEVILEESNQYTRNFQYERWSYNEDYIPYSKEDILNIYFNILNNGWDSFTFYCPKEYESCNSDIKEIANDEVLLSKINSYVHPYNSFEKMDTTISSLGEITVNVQKKYSDEKINVINLKVNEIMNELKLDGLTNEEKIKLIHNYIISNSAYDKDAADGRETIYDSSSAYGNLIERYGVCSGYSDSMAIFLDILNIPNLKVSSDNHIWNLVLINGKWLNIDLTWDDVENSKYTNNYFLITTKELQKLDSAEHVFDENFYLEAL